MDDDSKTLPIQKSVPLWVAVGVMLAIMLGGGALIWKYLYRPPVPRQTNVVSPAPGQPRIVRSGGNLAAPQPTADALAAAKEAELPDGVHGLPSGGTLVKAGDAYLKAFPRADDPQPSFSLGFFSVDDSQWEHGYLSNGVRRALGDGEYAKSLGVSAEQVRQLEELPAAPGMRWPDEARERLSGLYAKWKSAGEKGKADAERALVAELQSVAQAKRSADQQSMTQRVAKIRAILTARQVEAMNPIPRWNLPTTKKSGG
jgi:hypothetical protein